MRGLLLTLVSMSVAAGAFQAHASSLLFTASAGGTVAVTIGSSVTTVTSLGGNITIDAPSSTDTALAFADTSGAGFKTNTGTSPTTTIAGEIDFSDAAATTTSGSCSADSGGVCKVDTSTSFGSSTSVSGATQEDASVVTAAANQWNAVINTSTGWGSTAGTAQAVNVNLSSGGKLCVGSGLTGCTATASTTTTLTINGTQQTAYVFNVTTNSSDYGAIGGNVTINAGTITPGALVVLNYTSSGNGSQALSSGASFTLTGGLTDDQVLLNIEGGGLTTSSGFTFNGDVSIQGSMADLDDATIHGRLYIDTSGSETDELGEGFDLVAPPDITPEPGAMFLMGAALVGLGLIAKKRKV